MKKKVTIVFDNQEDNQSDDDLPRERTYTTAENMMMNRLDTIYRKKNQMTEEMKLEQSLGPMYAKKMQ